MQPVTPEEFAKWRIAAIERESQKTVSVLQSWGVPSPAPKPWQKETQ